MSSSVRALSNWFRAGRNDRQHLLLYLQVKISRLLQGLSSCSGKGVARPLRATPPTLRRSSPRPTLRPKVGTQRGRVLLPI